MQQNAFHDVDTYCSMEKQFKMLRVIISYYDLAGESLKKGVPLNDIVAMPVLDKLSRMKEIPETEISSIDTIIDEIKDSLLKLEEGGAVSA